MLARCGKWQPKQLGFQELWQAMQFIWPWCAQWHSFESPPQTSFLWSLSEFGLMATVLAIAERTL